MTEYSKSVKHLRFYEIKKSFWPQVADIEKSTQGSKEADEKPGGKRGRYSDPAQQKAAVEEMKKSLLAGLSCKVACLCSGYTIDGGRKVFKRRTGMSMTEFRISVGIKARS